MGKDGEDYLLRVVCSKGTYVRTICHDIGAALGCGGCMSSLRRTAIGGFKVSDALDFDKVKALCDEGKLESVLYPTDSAFENLPAVYLNQKGMARAVNGAFISADEIAEGELDRGGRALFCHKTFFIKD